MTHKERLLRNEIVVNLSKEDISQSSVGKIVGLGQSQVSLILSWAHENSVLSMPTSGRPPLLDAEKLLELVKFLEKGAESYGFTGDYWTHKRVKHVIAQEFGIIYEEKQAGRILKKIGWSRQKPQKKEAKQDLAKAEAWKSEGLATLKKKALVEDYDIYYHDESTVQLCANVVKTYAPKGKTPVLALHDTKGYQYVCLASSISPEGKMYYEMRNKGFKGAEIVEYLKALLQTTDRKIMLIWDNASWHKSQEVKDFLITEVGQRLWVANTPAYSPEFNPSELIWANLKRVQIASTCAKNLTQLKKIVAKGMDFIIDKVELVKSFFNIKNYYFTDS